MKIQCVCRTGEKIRFTSKLLIGTAGTDPIIKRNRKEQSFNILNFATTSNYGCFITNDLKPTV